MTHVRTPTHSEMLCTRWNLKFMPNFKLNGEKPMAEFNQKNLSQISMIKMDDPYQIAVKKTGSNKADDFIYSYRPMYYFARFFGLLPFSFVYDSNGELQAPRVTIFDGVWFVLSVVFYLMLAISSFEGFEIIPNDPAPLVNLINALLLTVGLCNGATMIVVNMCVRFRFTAILKTITAFDKEASLNRFNLY